MGVQVSGYYLRNHLYCFHFWNVNSLPLTSITIAGWDPLLQCIFFIEFIVLFLACVFQKYMIPMKTQGVLDSNLVDDIFYKINEIYMHHATFLAFLEVALNSWDNSSSIGDHILRTVSYTFFIIISFHTICVLLQPVSPFAGNYWQCLCSLQIPYSFK